MVADTLFRTLIVSLVWLALFIPVVRKGSPDVTWELSTIVVCVITEANLVLVCGCFPALKLLARRILPKWFGENCDRAIPPPMQPLPSIVRQGDTLGCERSKASGGTNDSNHLMEGFGIDSEMVFPFSRSLPVRTAGGELGVLPDP